MNEAMHVVDDEEMEEAEKETSGSLSSIAEKAEEMIRIQDEIAQLEIRLEQKRADLHRIESSELPELMGSMATFKLQNGWGVEVTEITKAALPTLSAIEAARKKDEEKAMELEQRREDGFQFLRDNEAESLIKNKLALEFSKGQDNIVGDFIAKAEEAGLPTQRVTEVHNATLSKWVKERMEKGLEVPMDLFGVYCGRKAVLKKPKKK